MDGCEKPQDEEQIPILLFSRKGSKRADQSPLDTTANTLVVSKKGGTSDDEETPKFLETEAPEDKSEQQAPRSHIMMITFLSLLGGALTGWIVFSLFT